MRPTIRPAAVAGAFYPSDPATLRRQITWCFQHEVGPGSLPARAAVEADRPAVIIAPHAGYRYSGPIAAHAYRHLLEQRRPDLIVVIGPNHRMLGAPVALPSNDYWQTPLGAAAIHQAAIASLRRLAPVFQVDDLAHRDEHSIEVQLPFLQHGLGDGVTIVPIVTYAQDFGASCELGMALAHVLRGLNAAVVATSDFTHYESHSDALRRDRYALRAIESLDAETFAIAVVEHGLSICGPSAIVAAMVAGRELGATKATTLRYGTSAELSGDFDRVVGYAAIALE